MKHGNQYASRKTNLMDRLDTARSWLSVGAVLLAQDHIAAFRVQYAKAPASTRRRWRCGH